MDHESPGFRGNLALKNGFNTASSSRESNSERAGEAYAHDDDSAWELVEHGLEDGSDDEISLYGMWVEDVRPGRFETNIQTFEQLQQVIEKQSEEGFCPADIFGSGRFFEPWSIAFTRSDALGTVWQVTADAGAFKRRHEEMLRQGYKLAAFNRRHRNFNAVWEPSAIRAQPVAWNMGWSELLALDKRQRERGLRISSVDRYGPSGAHYAAVWEPGDGEQMIEAPGGMNAGIPASISMMVDRYADAGLFVQAFGHNEHAVVAYRSDVTLAKRRFACLPIARFRAYDQICLNGGYRLATISHANWPGN